MRRELFDLHSHGEPVENFPRLSFVRHRHSVFVERTSRGVAIFALDEEHRSFDAKLWDKNHESV